MKTRILSGLMMLPLLAFIYFGGLALCLFCLAVAVLGVREFYKGFETIGIKPCKPIGYAAALALYGIGYLYPSSELYMLWFFGVTVASLLYLFRIEERVLSDAMATMTGAFYVVYFSFHVYLIDGTKTPILLWLVLFSAFGTDVFAYFSGFLFGRHKLCPKISPKKTIEGAIGGTLGSIALCAGFGWFLAPELFYHCLVIGFLGAVVAQFGDLTASIFKRKMGIKDYGNLIPGHGGVLDRFDSILFTAPLIYYYILFVV
ncbi:MAG: phosphatidate cytidylyltransferase [Eubacteriales bacterium]|nr:phosphatidate cytidylyltransferase [Eubacteriales bacterium]MDD3349882.1 phosphatidate cytidylyltransferase [Eubacteriales bacterium]